MKKLNRNIDGITLIALVISIIVMLILAGVSIGMLIGENGILTQAQKAKEQTEKASEEEQQDLDKMQVELSKYDGTTIGRKQDNENRTLSGKTEGYTSKNPIIPKGFVASDDGAAWYYTDESLTEVAGWNDGLVIENDIGDQFVWVPCSKTETNDVVKYEERFEDFNSKENVEDFTVDKNAVPVTDETSQIIKYGGFYVARFEAGNDSGDIETEKDTSSIPKSKYGSKIWAYITYNDSVKVAKLMINDESKYGTTKSGLITATQWDTIMTWYEKSSIGITAKTQDWGSYFDSDYNLNGFYVTREQNKNWDTWKFGTKSHTSNEYPALYHASGLNTNGYKKNIADLAGNMWEWVAEYGERDNPNLDAWVHRRGGSAFDLASECAVSHVSTNTAGNKSGFVGFRVVLYNE